MQCLKSSLCLSSSTLTYTYRTLRYNHRDLNSLSSVASQLRSRSVVRFSGPDTVKFLQGLLTNDVRRFAAAHEVSSLYAALLTPQGRFLYDFFLYKPPSIEEKLNETGSGPSLNRGEEFQLFADVDSEVLDEIIQTFKRYRLRSKVDIDSVAEEFSCWQLYGGNNSNSSSPAEDDNGWRWFKDPRLHSLGYRGIFPSSSKTKPPLVEAEKETEEANYLQWRLENGVAEGSTEMPKGEAMPLEYNLEGLNAISFDKGCYVGQELIARTHHRGIIRKRLMPLKFLENGGKGKSVDQKVSPGSEIIDGGNGKKVGVVTAALDCRGLGLMRLEDTFKGADSLTIKGLDGVKVEAVKPTWWPPEWFQEH